MLLHQENEFVQVGPVLYNARNHSKANCFLESRVLYAILWINCSCKHKALVSSARHVQLREGDLNLREFIGQSRDGSSGIFHICCRHSPGTWYGVGPDTHFIFRIIVPKCHRSANRSCVGGAQVIKFPSCTDLQSQLNASSLQSKQNGKKLDLVT